MDFQKELKEMRANYKAHSLKDIFLKWPQWMRVHHPYAAIFHEKQELLKRGEIYYAYIVQANDILFRFFPHTNHPAHFLYSTSITAAENPYILANTGMMLYSYKNQGDVPEEWREIVDVITDEYDPTPFAFLVPTKSGANIDMHFLPAMIFRKLIPSGVVKSSIVPILALPDKCKSIMILPKRYWTKAFKKAWLNNQVM